MAVPLCPTAVAPGPPPPAAARRSTYREVAPPPVLVEVAACTWEGRAGWSRALRVLPDGCVDLTWDGRAVRVTGAVPGPVRHPVDPRAPHVGLRLRPGWPGPVLGVPARRLPPAVELAALGDAHGVRNVEEQLTTATTDAARRRLLADLVTTRLTGGRRPDRRLVAAARRLAAGAPVRATADAVGLSVRQLGRHFDHDVGLGPKAFQTVHRFQRFLRAARQPAASPTLADAAVECGYTDQSHLARDCRRLAGATPSVLVARLC